MKLLVLGVVIAGGALLALPLTREQQPATSVPLTAAERGRELGEALGCVACHSLDGRPGIGPSWKDSYGSLRTFADGSAARVDANYLRESMANPAARVVNGYQNVMLPAALTTSQADDIIALFRELSVHQSD